MSLRLIRKTLIVGALEPSYSVLPSFSYSADSFEVNANPELTFPHDRIEKDTIRPTIGARKGIVAGLHAQLRFSLELKGSGYDDTNKRPLEPRIGRLLEACLFDKSTNWDSAITWTASTSYSVGDYVVPTSENGFVYKCITAGTSGSSEPSWPTTEGATITDGSVEWQAEKKAYIYTPSNGILGDDVPSIAFEVYLAGSGSQADKYVLAGCGGTWTFTGSVGNIATMEFTFTGKLYSDPTTATIPSASFDETSQLVFQGVDFTFDNQDIFCVNEVRLDCGNTVALRRCITEESGIAGVLITNRNITGSIDPEAVLQSDYDFFAKLKSGDTASMKIDIGSEFGNSVSFEAPRVQITESSFSDRDGIAVNNLNLLLTEGDDSSNTSELIIKFK